MNRLLRNGLKIAGIVGLVISPLLAIDPNRSTRDVRINDRRHETVRVTRFENGSHEFDIGFQLTCGVRYTDSDGDRIVDKKVVYAGRQGQAITLNVPVTGYDQKLCSDALDLYEKGEGRELGLKALYKDTKNLLSNL